MSCGDEEEGNNCCGYTIRCFSCISSDILGNWSLKSSSSKIRQYYLWTEKWGWVIILQNYTSYSNDSSTVAGWCRDKNLHTESRLDYGLFWVGIFVVLLRISKWISRYYHESVYRENRRTRRKPKCHCFTINPTWHDLALNSVRSYWKPEKLVHKLWILLRFTAFIWIVFYVCKLY
jgi:hypothetical protein